MNMKEAREALEKNPFEPMVDSGVLAISGLPFMKARTAFCPWYPREEFDMNMKYCTPLL
ncbi:hypothetical protein ACFU44_00535 [Nocardia rhizosphaerihabitans]|uniref:hypothetical protein n=1 Tax=Nocardia rhizosphaerihabitans TaxID=1691570 RepID=UPI00366D8921